MEAGALGSLRILEASRLRLGRKGRLGLPVRLLGRTWVLAALVTRPAAPPMPRRALKWGAPFFSLGGFSCLLDWWGCWLSFHQLLRNVCAGRVVSVKLERFWLAGSWYQMLLQLLTVVVSKRLKWQPGEGAEQE